MTKRPDTPLLQEPQLTRWNQPQTPNSYNQGYIPAVAAINATFASSASGDSTIRNGTLTEIACAARKNCNVDALAFRAILARALSVTRALTPDVEMTATPSGGNVSSGEPAWSLHERIDFILRTSAMGAAAQCSGGKSGTTCGSDWGSEEWDGSEGLGQDLSALNVFLANIRFEGKLASVNGTASGSGNGGNGTEEAGGEDENGEDGAAATDDDVAGSEGAAGRVAVLSSVGLLVVGASSLMALL
jgi:mannan endo-1,6-alpha-mannosidase